MKRTRYQRAAARAVDTFLAEQAHQEAVTFAYLAEGVADPAARALGKRRDLFELLWSYECILPSGADVFWNGGCAKVRNPNFKGPRTLLPQRAQAGVFDAAIDFGLGRAYLPHSA